MDGTQAAVACGRRSNCNAQQRAISSDEAVLAAPARAARVRVGLTAAATCGRRMVRPTDARKTRAPIVRISIAASTIDPRTVRAEAAVVPDAEGVAVRQSWRCFRRSPIIRS